MAESASAEQSRDQPLDGPLEESDLASRAGPAKWAAPAGPARSLAQLVGRRDDDAERALAGLVARRATLRPVSQPSALKAGPETGIWVDPEEMPFTPQPRPGNPFASRIFGFWILLLFLAALAWLVVPEVHFRIVNRNELHYSGAVLSAQAVPLAPLTPSVVDGLYVDPDHVSSAVIPAGQPIARLRWYSPDETSEHVSTLAAPFDARLVSVDTLVGGVAAPGVPVVTVYDPAKMFALVTVLSADLGSFREGMVVRLDNGELDKPLRGRLVSAVPLLGTVYEPNNQPLINLRIRLDSAEARHLVPGLRFDVAIKTNSVPSNAPRLTHAGGTVRESKGS